jgi:hypothetical protein
MQTAPDDPPIASARTPCASFTRLTAWVQGLIALSALVFCFRGQGKAGWWLALALSMPLVGALVSAGRRDRLVRRLSELWQSVEAFAASRAHLPWLATALFVVVPAGLLFLSNNGTWGSGDTWPVVPAACSLVTRGHWDLTEYLPTAPAAYLERKEDGTYLPYPTMARRDGIYSSYPAGMVQFALPVALAARCLGADLHSRRVHNHLEKWTAAWVAAAAVGTFFLIALHLAPPSAAWLVALLLASGSALFSTVGQGLWQHGGVIFWSLVLLLAEFRCGDRPSHGWTMVGGLACGMMLACRLSAALIILPYGAWALLRSPRRALAVALVAGVAYLPWAVAYWRTYGTLFGPSTGQLESGNWQWNLTTLAAVLVSPSHGLLIYQPWLLLALAPLVPAVRRALAPRVAGREPAGWTWFCAAVIVLQILLVSSWRCWYGGSCYGSRLTAECIPLAALLAVRPIAALCQTRGGRAVLAAALLSVLLHVPAVYQRAGFWHESVGLASHPEKLWSWSRPPFLYAWQH